MSNFKHVHGNTYIVYTQAGFRKASKVEGASYLEHMTSSEYFNNYLTGFPDSYPSLVSYTQGYHGYNYKVATCIPISKIKDLM